MKIPVSKGFKRKIAALLNAILAAVQAHPELGALTQLVSILASTFGITGLVHATKDKTAKKYKTLSLVSLLSLLTTAAIYVPALTPYLGVIASINGILSAVGLFTFQKKK